MRTISTFILLLLAVSGVAAQSGCPMQLVQPEATAAVEATDVPQTYTIQDENSGHQLTFNYPADWVLKEEPNGYITLASTQEVLLARDVIDHSTAEPLKENEFTIRVGMMSAAVSTGGIDEETSTALVFVDAVLQTGSGDVEIIREAQAADTNCFRAASSISAFWETKFEFLIVELDNQDQPEDDFYYATILVSGAVDTPNQVLDELGAAVAASLIYDRAD